MLRVSVFDFAGKYVVPAIKKRLVEILYREYDLNQLTISRLLGVSQSSVSKLISRPRKLALAWVDLPSAEEKVRELAEELIKGDLSDKRLESAINRLTLELLRRKSLCQYHSLVIGNDRLDSCDLCPELFNSDEPGARI
ncbi:MAG: hypothetical protein QXP80_01625 [Zestosphaera sp.]